MPASVLSERQSRRSMLNGSSRKKKARPPETVRSLRSVEEKASKDVDCNGTVLAAVPPLRQRLRS